MNQAMNSAFADLDGETMAAVPEESQEDTFPRFQYFINTKNGRKVLGNKYQRRHYVKLGLKPCDPPPGAIEKLKAPTKQYAQPSGNKIGVDMSDDAPNPEMGEVMAEMQKLAEQNAKQAEQMAAQQAQIAELLALKSDQSHQDDGNGQGEGEEPPRPAARKSAAKKAAGGSQ